MKRKTLSIALAPLLIVCGLIFATEPRTWTSADGREIEAEFVSATAMEVTIKRSLDGESFTIPLAKLSEVDRDWVTEKKRAQVAKLLPNKKKTGLAKIPEKTDGLIQLPLRIHIITDIELKQKGMKMSTWVTRKDIEKDIFPEINRIWKPAGIQWVIESIVEQQAKEVPDREGAITSILNAKRNGQEKPDPARVDSINAFCGKENGHRAINNLYFFPYLGQTFQGYAGMRGNYAVIGVWTDKPSRAARRPEKFTSIEKGRFKTGSIARTCAHELGHNLGLEHPDSATQVRFDRVMGGKHPGNEWVPEEIELARKTAIIRAEKVIKWESQK